MTIDGGDLTFTGCDATSTGGTGAVVLAMAVGLTEPTGAAGLTGPTSPTKFSGPSGFVGSSRCWTGPAGPASSAWASTASAWWSSSPAAACDRVSIVL